MDSENFDGIVFTEFSMHAFSKYGDPSNAPDGMVCKCKTLEKAG